MDVKAIFQNLNVLWTRWSEYEIITDRGAEYLVPTKNATELTYNCAEHPEALVSDALELGRQLLTGAAEKERLCAAFAARYGLLGLDAERNPAALDDPAVPPCYRLLNSHDYGEDLGLFQLSFMCLYQHYLTTRGKPTAVPLDLSGFLGYRLTSGRTPQLTWDVRSMESVIRFSYAAIVTSPGTPLKVCKNCGKVYYNTHAKSEFCGVRCRNYYNVKVFRDKAKENNQTGNNALNHGADLTTL